jgi:hypothetical protein
LPANKAKPQGKLTLRRQNQGSLAGVTRDMRASVYDGNPRQKHDQQVLLLHFSHGVGRLHIGGSAASGKTPENKFLAMH